MNLWWIKKKMAAPPMVFEAGSLYIIDDGLMQSLISSVVPDNMKKHYEIIDIYKTFEPWKVGDRHKMLIVRTGGIGDIIALSSLCKYLESQGNPVVIASQPSMRVIVEDWFDCENTTFKDLSKPIFTNWTSMSTRTVRRVMRRFFCEDVIEEGSAENWYKIFFDSIDHEFHSDLGRPRLKTSRKVSKSKLDKSKPSILICHRASANMRSMEFADIYAAVCEVIGDTDCTIYTHKAVLTKDDAQFIFLRDDKRVDILDSESTEDYLLDVYDASIVIAVDTGSVHFREGIQKPAIGIYGAFSTKCRTEHYKYVHTFNVQSECPHQPCYMHQTEHDQICKMSQPGVLSSPCVSLALNPSLHEQLISGIRNTLLLHV
jgi:ADP-heptose:LPS heptosyltransferase